MAEPDETQYYQDLEKWCEAVAGLVADALVDGKVVAINDFTLTKEIIAEEVYTRLTIGDYPPPLEDAPHFRGVAELFKQRE